MENPPSPLDALRQLKEMLDAGALTPAEFEALKQRLVLGGAPVPPAGPAPAAPVPTPEVLLPPPPPAEQHSPMFEDVAPDDAPAEAAGPPVGTSHATGLVEAEAGWTDSEFSGPEAAPVRNPLALILSIGGLLALLVLVIYLSFNRRPSEHISSTSQTAADSLTSPIETGPQAEQLPQPTTVPETLRVAPTHPAPAARDSTAAAPPAAPDSVASH
ncbi:MAG: hypothetical protein NVSMB30_26010 [Hymenobacter sp.]